MKDSKLINLSNNKKYPIELRPNASPGYWLCTLIPIVYSLNAIKYNYSIEYQYKISTIISFGLLLKSVLLFLKFDKINSKTSRIIVDLLINAVISYLLWIWLKQEILFSIFLGFFSMQLYDILYCYILNRLRKSFTFGEAAIITQGVIIFVCSVIVKFSKEFPMNLYSTTHSQQIETILQIALSGLIILICITNFIKIFRQPIVFCLFTLFIIIGICIFPITKENDRVIVILLTFIFGDFKRTIITFIYLGLLTVAVVIVAWYINNKTTNHTTTRTRKIFHILIVFVYVPGILYQCSYVFIVSGLFLGVLIGLELIRLIKLPFVADILNDAVHTFIDDKDSGPLALTPIYLLIGCSIPLWLYPFSCGYSQINYNISLILLSGILSVGIGDTAASYFGSIFGQHKWRKSTKSIEGLIASILCQGLFVIGLYFLGELYYYTNYQLIKIGIAIITNAIVETETDQIDNLVLPLITFSLLIL